MAAARPRQVTTAVWLIIGGSVLTILLVADQFQSFGSMKLASTISEAIDYPVFADAGVSVHDVESWLRALGMVAAACATASAILGWQVLQQRSTSARLWLSVLAVPLLVAALCSSGLLAALAPIGVLTLWLDPARAWLAGTWTPTPPGERSARTASPTPPPAPPVVPPAPAP
ncbi:MAG: hypothetical protein QM572_13210, partial [Nocardioides sp.]|uniref:hypothetical protein n=1 Tax=Nocardioides sp. TaxID=35761 RepID=UPI0039E5A65C